MANRMCALEAAQGRRASLWSVFTILLILSAASGAEGACVATVNASVSGQTLTVTGTGSGTCGGSGVRIYLDGNQIGAKACAESSCTLTVTYPTSCLRSGTHEVRAFATCAKPNPGVGPECIDDEFTSATAAITVDTTPTVSISYSPDEEGRGIAMVPFNFPNTNSSLDRRLSLLVDGTQVAFHQPAEISGVWTPTLNSTCWTGAHSVKAVAVACNAQNDPDFTDEAETTVSVDSKPSVSIAYVPAVEPVRSAVTVTYAFPNTSSSLQRYIAVDLDGQTLALLNPGDSAGTQTWRSTRSARPACTRCAPWPSRAIPMTRHIATRTR